MDLSFFFIFTIDMIKTEAVLDETLFGQQTEPVSKCLPEHSNVDQLLVNLMKSQEKVRTLMHYTATFRWHFALQPFFFFFCLHCSLGHFAQRELFFTSRAFLLAVL